MRADMVVLSSSTNVEPQCCQCGVVLGEEQYAVYSAGRVLWACSLACRAQYQEAHGA